MRDSDVSVTVEGTNNLNPSEDLREVFNKNKIFETNRIFLRLPSDDCGDIVNLDICIPSKENVTNKIVVEISRKIKRRLKQLGIIGKNKITIAIIDSTNKTVKKRNFRGW
ncbi:MAG: hypothetical protein KKB03_01620 [Nanoarchaeota archaeon]|nr:hypothetical protein [Nanoarchaeota archaeon]MBU1135489.1 hypothetical protein [Nanoarchaeota archaeon]MBU2519924.1 hypothetical protein [Nanoarchaeota archaeon]